MPLPPARSRVRCGSGPAASRCRACGRVRNPEAFREASLEETEALEHWREVCGKPLDHLELAEELLDRVGERRGWRSPQALEVALLLKGLELLGESPWFVRKTAEAVVALYAEMDEHCAGGGETSLHPHVRASVRRLERLEEIDRVAPESGSATETEAPSEVVETSRSTEEEPERVEPPSNTEGPHAV